MIRVSTFRNSHNPSFGRSSAAPTLDFNATSGAAFDIMVSVLERCDEPTRDQAHSVCRSMSRACTEARRKWARTLSQRPGRWTKEAVPTMLELADNGCLLPNSLNVVRTLFGSRKPPPQDDSLHWFHHRRGLLDEAYNYGVAAFCATHRSAYSGWIVNHLVGGFLPPKDEEGGYGRIYTFPERSEAGDLREGAWRGRELDGLGFYRKLPGGLYEGFYRDGVRQGPGAMVANNIRYEGEFSGGELNGVGTIRGKQGIYRGQVSRSKRHGQGEETDLAGNKIVGSWEHDVLVRRHLAEG